VGALGVRDQEVEVRARAGLFTAVDQQLAQAHAQERGLRRARQQPLQELAGDGLVALAHQLLEGRRQLG